jgi:hypothetical protein
MDNNKTKEEESQEVKTEKKAVKAVKEDNLTPWKPGESGNPMGRPKGSKNFSTKFKQAVEVIAKSEEKSVDEAMLEIFKTAYDQAKKGNFNYFKDLMDRVYGKPVQRIDAKSEVREVSIVKFVDGMRKIADEE